MASRSCTNLFDLASGGLLDIPCTPRALPRVMTVPGIISDVDSNDDGDSDSTSSVCRERKIVVANMLPLHAKKDPETDKWRFSLDEDSILLQSRDGFSPETEVVYVGSLKAEIDISEQDEVAQKLLEEFNCVPTFLPSDLQKKFYLGFCKQQLWPLFHYMLPMCPDHGDRFDRSLWQAYVSANKIFADKVMEVINPEDDCVWVHDYHLMVLPTFLRKRYYRVKLGFFLHSPFPSSEIYRTMPVRDEILRGLLNCDLIGFHTFDYARHFLSCCSRMLGLDYESKRGHIGLDYFGRTVYIKILPVGVHMGQLESALNLPNTTSKIKEIQEQFKGKKMILGIDDMDIFKGISLKFLALEQLLQQNPELQGKIVLVQIVNPARGLGKDVQEAKSETYLTARRINEVYGSPTYEPVVLIDRPVPRYEKTAYYAVAECCIVNAVRDGMNLVPYKYIVCRQGTPLINEALGITEDSPQTSMLVVSEFIGCSPSLSGAIRVNPWDIDAVADALNLAITMPKSEKQLRHEKHYRYVSSHDVAYWARSFAQDLDRACRDHYSKRCWGIGLGLRFRVVSLSPNFRKLSVDHIVSAYKRTNRRAIFLDYDGTVIPEASIIKAPSPEVLSLMNSLCKDPKNTVFIVSGRGRTSLSDWFASCETLGIAAEHGYFLRWNRSSEWETSPVGADLDWKEIVEPVMRLYTEATDGSNIETKESALVWHHQDADPDFGSCQAKELLDHLENVLSNEPAVVKRGQHIVEVKPQGVSKGLVAEKILSRMVNDGKAPDFVMCIGDDRSDEDMFERLHISIFLFQSSYSLSLSLPLIFLFPPNPTIKTIELPNQNRTNAKKTSMDPCPFVRILVGDLTVKYPTASRPSSATVHPSSSPCFCKIKLTNFPHQSSTVPLILSNGQNLDTTTHDHSLSACFNLNKTQIESLASKRPCLKLSIYTGGVGATCGLHSGKLLGRVIVPLSELGLAESRPVVYQNGWVAIGGGKKNGSGSSSAQLFLSVRAEPDPRFVFQFDGEPECSPQVFQVQGNVKQPVFTCKFGFRDMQSRSMSSEPGTPRNWLPFGGAHKEQSAKERKGWSITIHDLSGSPVAAASMVTPFVASPGSHCVSRSNPGAWLILRPNEGTWQPWGRLESWLERGGSDTVGYRFELQNTTLANSTLGAKTGGKFSIDLTSSLTPANSPHSSFDFGSGTGSRPGSGSGSDFGFGLFPQLIQRGFVMSSTVEGVGKCSKPEVEVGVQHVTCTEDAAAYVALAAAMDLSMDACRPFCRKLRKELRQQ